LENGLNDTLAIREDVVVPKAQHAPSLSFEPSGTPDVSLIISVLAAVGLDNDAISGARKIDDKWAGRVLAAKTIAT